LIEHAVTRPLLCYKGPPTSVDFSIELRSLVIFEKPLVGTSTCGHSKPMLAFGFILHDGCSKRRMDVDAKAM